MPHMNGDIHFAFGRMNRAPEGGRATGAAAAAATVDSCQTRDGNGRVVIVITTRQAGQPPFHHERPSVKHHCRHEPCLTPATPPFYLDDLIGTSRKQSTFQTF